MAASGKNPKKRNSLAGTKKGKSESAAFFQDNEESRRKKNEYNTNYHKTKKRKDYRVKLNKSNRKKGTYGNGDGLDESEDANGNTKKESQKVNRANNGKGKRPRYRKTTKKTSKK